ncbi:MAG: hypothetical protein RO257_18280 [Candidatus Kapabacteria bacterium]|nr:hypothetical protein [Candidatus Kapabacteria bacterium]
MVLNLTPCLIVGGELYAYEYGDWAGNAAQRGSQVVKRPVLLINNFR